MKPKRLFLFAAYDRDGTIDNTLVYYITSLAKLGTVIFVMDSNCPETELKKVQKHCVYAIAERHQEYDFGSYKRGFIWAHENLNLSDYEYLYLINDSMYGPLFDLEPYLENMERLKTDAFGMAKNPHRTSPHIQSWFIGMRKSVFLSDWFRNHLGSISHQESKGMITVLYEHGFTKKLIENNLSWDCLFSASGRSIYNTPKRFFKHKMPFIKKMCFNRHYGAQGRQLLYILSHIEPNLRNTIITNANRTYGKDNIDKTLTANPFKILYRNIRYTIHKLRNEGI